MTLRYTDGTDRDFIGLCERLDEYLVGIAGGVEQHAPYARYNTLESIRDVIVACEGDTPVGCGSFKRYDDGVAEVKRVFVLPAFRGRGIAKAIMAELERRAVGQGYRTLILETGQALREANSLYRGIGFAVTPNYGPYADMPQSVCMRKELAP